MDPLETPGPTIGVVGGGQLGRMLGEAAAPLGVELVVLDPTPDCPSSPVARDQIVADFDDPAGIAELADRADYLTFEIELADPEVLADVTPPVHPQPETLAMIQDKLQQKRTLASAGIPVPEFQQVDSVADLEAAVEEFGGVMLKAREGGYDGRGNKPVTDPSRASDARRLIEQGAMAERLLDFKRELSVIGVKGAEDTVVFPVGENIHREEILRETIVPARATPDVRERAHAVAEEVLSLMEGRGVYGIELFQDSDDRILVNEIAPRPHNSGHWTIEGAVTSQFEQHVRAVLGWPLGATDLRSPTVMTNLLGDVEQSQPATLHGVTSILDTAGAALHWYGKQEARPLRKLGHVTVTADGTSIDSQEQLLECAHTLRDGVTFKRSSQQVPEDR